MRRATRNSTGPGSAGSARSRMSRSKCGARSQDHDRFTFEHHGFCLFRFSHDLILKRCNFFWICLRHGPNADRFHNNGKIPIKLADSRGKSFDSAMPGGVDELVLAPAKIENCAGCMAKHRTWVSELPGGIASAGRGG